MLTERELELLTASVDGELSPRRRRHVERLLARSAEARDLLRHLQRDSRQVIDLPRVSAPPDLAASVMAGVLRAKRRPAPRPRPAPRTLPVWTGWAAAAAVLLAVGLGTFWHYSAGPDDPVARKPNLPDVKDRPDDDAVAKQVPPAPPPDVPPEDPPHELPADPGPETPKKVPERSVPVQKPLVEKPREVVFGDGSVEPFSKLERIELSLPVVLRLHELTRDDEAKRLREQLEGPSAVRVELPARNATRAFERVKAAMDARKIALVIDPAAQAKLKAPQFRHDYAVYFENVSPADLAELLAAAGASDRTAGEKKAGEQRFDGAAVVRSATAADAAQLADLIGVDPIRVRPAAAKPTAIDLNKPLSEQTGGQIDDVLDGKRTPRPNTTQPGLSALVVPLGVKSRSAEVKRFLEGRKPAREGTLQVFLVLRQVS